MRYRLVMPFLREPSHILILLIVVVILFGAKRLPDSARSLGRSLRIFKSEMKDMKEDGKDKKDGSDGAAGQ
jgi:TatA/E family protein of Tat protein translocase